MTTRTAITGEERTSTEQPGGRRRVLFVARLESRHRSALLRARAIAASEGCDLRIVLCAPPERYTSRVLFPQRGMEAMRLGTGEARRIELAEAWAARVSPDASVHVERGDVSTIAQHAARHGHVKLLVVPACDLDRCRDAVWIATEAHVPVLVVRGTIGRTTVVAATDMTDLEFPVVGCASALARHTGARVVAIHNTPLYVVEPTTPYGATRSVGPTPDDLRVKGDRLAEAVRKHHPEVETVHSTAMTAALAVLDTAATAAADVVAVGARRRTWMDRVVFGSVPEAIVERCHASVLIAPIEAEIEHRAAVAD